MATPVSNLGSCDGARMVLQTTKMNVPLLHAVINGRKSTDWKTLLNQQYIIMLLCKMKWKQRLLHEDNILAWLLSTVYYSQTCIYYNLGVSSRLV